jgi:hypothetical protein
MEARKPSRRVFASVALAGILAVLPFTSSVAQAQGVVNRGFTTAISGTATAADGTVQALTGTFTIQRFARSQRQIFAMGTVVGTLTSAEPGAAPRTFVTQVAMPLVMPSEAAPAGEVSALATCDVLNLVLGPLDLNLLGLEIHLNQVVLDIVAVSGAGNLLGNLLCAITNLLNGGGALAQIVNLLNSLLAILG